MNTWIERERDWEPAARRQARENLVKWIWLAMAVAIVIVLALVASTPSHGQQRDATAVYVETHCVAVLTEAHVEKISNDWIAHDRPYEIDQQGNQIVHIPEQTLKLRCK